MDFTYLRPKKVWAALEGHPDRPGLRTVERWCAGAPVPQWVVAVMRDKLGAHEESPPAWAEGLADEVAIRVIESLPADLPEAAALLRERLAVLPPPPAESSPEADEPQAPGSREQPGQ